MRLPLCLLSAACLLPLVSVAGAADNIALFWNLYDAVISGGRILHDVAEGVGAVSKAIRAIDSFLDSTAQAQVTEALVKERKEEEEAQTTVGQNKRDESSTSASSSTPTSHSPVPNFSGCGALGLHIRDDTLPMTRMTDCCSTHDTCYHASCRANKKECDGRLRSCLFTVCDDRTLGKTVQQNCRGAAKLLFSGTMALSFQQYNTAQDKLACKFSSDRGDPGKQRAGDSLLKP